MDITYQNPENLRHRSDTVIYNGIAYLSGVVPLDTSADIQAQTQQVVSQLDERLARAGSSKDRILTATIWLEDVNRDIAAFNAVWNEWVVPGSLPSRSCVQATLQKGSLLEVAVIAAVS